MSLAVRWRAPLLLQLPPNCLVPFVGDEAHTLLYIALMQRSSEAEREKERERDNCISEKLMSAMMDRLIWRSRRKIIVKY